MIVVISHHGIEFNVDLYPISDRTGPAVLVLPGGGFREHTEHDGEGYARWLNRLGLHAVVLKYALVPDPFPLALKIASDEHRLNRQRWNHLRRRLACA